MANISEALTKEFEAQKSVYLKGITNNGIDEISGYFIMKKNKQLVYIHHLPGYKSQIDFMDSPTFLGGEYENENMIPCTKEEYMEAFNEALKVINSKL